MTLIDRIRALDPALLAQRDTQAVTDALNADETAKEFVEYWITDRGLVRGSER